MLPNHTIDASCEEVQEHVDIGMSKGVECIYGVYLCS